ncbi:MAG: hypothetical protein U1E78_06095 [Gammaproteobacteria bacterium]
MWRFDAFDQSEISLLNDLAIVRGLQEKVDLAFSLMHDRKNQDYTKAIQLLNEVLITQHFRNAEGALAQPKFAKDALYGKALYLYQTSLKNRFELGEPLMTEACFNLQRILSPSPSHLILYARCLKAINQFDLAFDKINQASEILRNPDCPYESSITIGKWKAQIKALSRKLKGKLTPKIAETEFICPPLKSVSSSVSLEEEKEQVTDELSSLAASMVELVLKETPSALTPQLNNLKSNLVANVKSKSSADQTSQGARGNKKYRRKRY